MMKTSSTLRQKYKASRSNNNNNNSSAPNSSSNRKQQQQKRDQHLSLLANRSPPPSPSPFGLQQDPNVSTLFPGVASVHPVDSFDAAMMMAVESSSVILTSPPKPIEPPPTSATRLPPQNRFVPQHHPKGGPAYEPEELSPTEGALQFVPAYAEASTIITSPPVTRIVTTSEDDEDDYDDFHQPHKHYDDGHKHYEDDDDDHSASWGAIAEEKKSTSPIPTTTVLDDRRKVLNTPLTDPAMFRRNLPRRVAAPFSANKVNVVGSVRGSSSHVGVADKWCSPSFRNDVENDEDRASSGHYSAVEETASAISYSRPTTRGPRMARLASLFSSRAVIRGGAPAAATPLTMTTNNNQNLQSEPKVRNTPNARNRDNTTTNTPTYTMSSTKGVGDDVVGKTPNIPPPSPSRSSLSGSTSSGYVAWPGTQDKKGKTVAIQSSYDDSSVGAAAFHRKGDLEDGSAEWMLNDNATHASLDDSLGSSTPSAFERSRVSRSAPRRRETTPPSRISPPLSIDHATSGIYRDESNASDFHLSAIAVDTATATTSPMMSPPSSVINHRVSRPRVYNMTTNDAKQTQQQASTQRSMAPLASITRPQQYQRATSTTSRGGASSSVVATSVASTAISIQNLFNHSEQRLSANDEVAVQSPEFDPWDVDTSSHPPSSPGGTSVSRGSSGYFGTNNVKDNDFSVYGGETTNKDTSSSGIYGVRTNVRGAASVMRRKADPQPPTEDALALNDHFSPPHRTFNSPGYPGFLDKTKDVPNLMDVVDSDSLTSSKANSTFSSAPHSNSGAPNHQTGVRRRHDQNTESRLRVDTEIKAPNDDDSDVFEGLSPQSLVDGGSDVFEGLSNAGKAYLANKRKSDRQAAARVSKSQNELNLVLLGGGLTTIQTPCNDYKNRNTASDFDDNLTNSEIDQYGFAKVPGFYDMARAGRKFTDAASPNSYEPMFEPGETPRAPTVTVPVRRPVHTPEEEAKHSPGTVNTSFGQESESGSSSLFSDPYPDEQPGFGRIFTGDLSQYYVQPDDVKKIIRKFRRMCRVQSIDLTDDEMEQEEDAKKAFALFEMRSRIMETDIDRGLERRGGTTVVDDLVLTPYNLAALRIRDAVIVSKAWRDGASPKDVVNSALLTRRAEHTFFIQRPVRYNLSPRGSSPGSSDGRWMHTTYRWEEVQWLDDTDFMLYRCPSLGSRNLRGFEIFTIGDCQSILLKLTNERCMELRSELNRATARQIDAEELMKEEGDDGDGMMTESEMIYLSSMEEVKTISRKLVLAEKAFNLVRDRIEKLVAKYEALLVKIENESYAPSSIVTCESSCYSDDGDSHYSSEEDREKEMLARRAQRAELRAELAVREALLRRQEVKKIQIDKQREIEALHGKLAELQSESSHAIADREHSVILARAIAAKGNASSSSLHRRGNKINQTTIDGVKQRFRDRMAAKLRVSTGQGSESSPSSFAPSPSNYGLPRTPSPRTPLPATHKYRLAGEEMFQHLDFYERSLKAVQSGR